MAWDVSHYRAYLYRHNVTVYTDHSAVKAVLGTTNFSGKHARWWTRVYINGVRTIDIVYRSGKENGNADALSRIPLSCPEQAIPQEGEPVCEVLALQGEDHQPLQTITELVEDPSTEGTRRLPATDLAEEQQKDVLLVSLIQYLTDGTLPQDPDESKLLLAKASFALIDKLLYHIDIKQRQIKQVVFPVHLLQEIIHNYHRERMSRHFSGPLLRHCHWDRKDSEATSSSDSSGSALPDHGSQHNGASQDITWQQLLGGVPGFPKQVSLDMVEAHATATDFLWGI